MKRLILIAVSALLMCACTDYLGQLEDDYPSVGKGDFVGKFVDVDGQEYKTVTIGKQTWMAQNMNYAGSSGTIKCLYDYYFENLDACSMFGRLYSKYEAERICPEGWSLPTENDVIELNNTLLKKYGDYFAAMKADYSWETLEGVSYKGSNRSGFELLPTGLYADGEFYEINETGMFWTKSSEYHAFDDGSYVMADIAFGVSTTDDMLSYSSIPEYHIMQSADYRLPVRCIKK